MTALALGVSRFSLDGLAPEPWKNGAGVTRTVIRSTGNAPAWRLSVADIQCEAAFSRFPGTDREAVLVAGEGVTLSGSVHSWAMTGIGDLVSFPGELPIVGVPTCDTARLWNVMTDRAGARARTQVGRQWICRIPAGSRGAFLVLSGQARVDLPAADGLAVTVDVSPGQGLVLQDCASELAVRFDRPDAHWVLTTFEDR